MKKINCMLTLLISSFMSVTVAGINEMGEDPLNYSCVEDLPPSAFGETRKRYKISDECGNEFFCTMTCIPLSFDTILAHRTNENELNIKVSVDAKLLKKLHITKTKNQIKIDLNTEEPSVTDATDVPNETIPTFDTTTFKPNETTTISSQSTTKIKPTKRKGPKSPCPCVIPHSNSNATTTSTSSTTTTTTTKKTIKTSKPRMPCPCIPISHKQTTTPSTTPTVPVESTQELTIRRSSIYETPNTAQALVETTTEQQEYNCTTIDATTTTEI